MIHNASERHTLSSEERQQLRNVQIQSALNAIYEIEKINETITAAINQTNIAEVYDEQVKPSVSNRFVDLPLDTLRYLRQGLITLRDTELIRLGRGIMANARHAQDSPMTITLEIPVEGDT